MISAHQAHAALSPSGLRPKPRVFLVDEDPQDLTYYAALLRQQGCEAVSCASYSEATARLECEAPDFVIVSQGGPEFKGRAVLERAVEIDRRLPTLVLARCPEVKWYLEAMQLGAVDYLEKNVRPADLAWIVETHLDRKGHAA